MNAVMLALWKAAAGRRVRLIALAVAAENVLSGLLLGGIFFTLCLQVLFRYVLKSPLTWTDEIARFCLVWLTMIAAAGVEADRAHVRLKFVRDRLGPRGRRWLAACGYVTVLVAAATFVWGGLKPWQERFGITATATGMPTSWLFAAPLVGYVLIGFHCIAHLVRLLLDKADTAESHIDGTI